MLPNPTNPQRVGALIRHERQRARLSQRALAERIGVGQSLLARWESGSLSPTMDQLDTVLAYFGVRLRLDVERRPDPAAEWAAEHIRLASMTPAERLTESTLALVGLVQSARRYGVETVVDGQLAALLQGVPGQPRRMQIAVTPDQVEEWLNLTWVVRYAVDEDLMTIFIPTGELALIVIRDGGGLLNTSAGYVRVRVVDVMPPTVRFCIQSQSETRDQVEADVIRLDQLPAEFRMPSP